MTALPAIVWLALAQAALPAPGIEGAWRPILYELQDGTSLPIDGQILFGEGHWSVLFFILEQGRPVRGSAEAGTYEVVDDKLTFFHRLRMADIDRGANSELIREIREGSPEAARYQVSRNELTIHFPSGNRMVFRRLKVDSEGGY